MPLGRVPSAEALGLLDAASCGLVQTSDDGTFRRANRMFCQWIGQPEDSLIGRRRIQDLLTVGGRIFHQTHWAPLLKMQGSISEVKLELMHADGTVIPMVLNAIRHEEDGEMVHEISAYVARDRDKYERELVLARKRLEALVDEARVLHETARDRALFAEQMIGIVSHDLRNPLNGIVMGSSLLARGELTTAQRNMLARVTRSAERANRLIADLLDFTQARLGTGLPVAKQPVDLHETISEAVDELSLAYAPRPIEHVRSGEGRCMADAGRLTQMLGNLVSNAMTYGTPQLAVTVTSTVEPKLFSVAVHNWGEPIAAETQARIFEPMTRGTTATSSVRSVGLGLFIVREIAKAHGGTALVKSTREEGTVFRAEFPR
ncbi:MAG TPA: PAS domain-containing sensor histidine kinase [Polyangia bacterium]|nr:PAS domain-containing sensor histidine kinase [Polyangia bacterium]